MKLFGSAREQTPVEQAQAALAKARDRRDRLATQLSQTQDELTRVKAAAAAAALREAPVEVSEISADVAQCSAEVEALSSAVAAATVGVSEVEKQLAEARDGARPWFGKNPT